MRDYHFVLWLDDAGSAAEAIEDRLYEAGCDDALYGAYFGRSFLEFDRTAETLLDAVVSALEAVHRAGLGVRRIGFDVEDLVTQAEIARRIERTTASISQLVSGQRGPGGFPAPYSVAGNTKLWMWGEVKTWFAHYDGTVDADTDDELQAIASAFDLVRHARDQAHRTLIVQRLAAACL